MKLGQPELLSNLLTEANSGSGHEVYVNTWFFVIPIGILKGSFRPITLRHTVLLGRKARYRFRILVVFRHKLIFLLSHPNRQLSQPVPVSLQLPSRICDSDLWFTSVRVRKDAKLQPLPFFGLRAVKPT